MLTPADVLPRLRAVCLDGATHPDYQLTASRATLYRRLATGRDLEQEMRRLTSRETEDQFLSRVRITTKTVPAFWEQGRKPFYQVARLRGGTVTRRFDYAEGLPATEADRRRARVVAAVDAYYNRAPLETYLAERLAKSHAMSDPNAWLLTEFAPFDFRTQVAQPYPVLIPCEAAVDFTRQAGAVSSFTARLTITQDASVFRYVCYLENEAVDCWPVLYPTQNTPVFTLPEGSAVFAELREPSPDGQPGKLRYQCRLLTHRAGRVPALPIGYVVDEEGSGETFVSPLHAGIPFLLQMLKVGSENDIVMSQMAFPVRVAYARPCPGTGLDATGALHACNHGIDQATFGRCGLCGGTGELQVAITSAETMTLPLPKPGEDVKVKPADLTAFISPPTDNPRLQLDYLEARGNLFLQTIFGQSNAARVAGSATATQRQIELQGERTALAPFADQNAALYVHAATVAAAYVDAAQGLDVVYEYPADLELETEDDLYAQRLAAVQAGADSATLEAIDTRIAAKQFANDPAELVKVRVKRRFMTCLGMTNAEVQALYLIGGMSRENWLLRTSPDIIFGELELDRPEFYQLAYAAQVPLVMGKVAELLAKLPAAAGAGSGVFPKMNLVPPAEA